MKNLNRAGRRKLEKQLRTKIKIRVYGKRINGIKKSKIIFKDRGLNID